MATNVRLLRRWGQNQPGATVEVDEMQAEWLVNNAFGTAKGVQAPSQEAFAPGGDGPDQLASVPGPRPSSARAPKRENGALPVPGAPKQYNAGVRDGEYPRSARLRPVTSGESSDGGEKRVTRSRKSS